MMVLTYAASSPISVGYMPPSQHSFTSYRLLHQDDVEYNNPQLFPLTAAGSHISMTGVCEDRKCKKRIAQFMTDFCSIQVKERVKEFLEKILQQIGAEHWHDRGAEEASLSAASETSPVEGKADDGVRGVPVHALVVTHGAYMCVAVRFFVEELHCSLPPGSDEAHMFALSPNTGLCRFLLTMRKEDDRFKLSGIRCVFVHRGDHVEK